MCRGARRSISERLQRLCRKRLFQLQNESSQEDARIVDKTGLEHQEEAFLVFFEYFDCCMKTVGQIGLIGKFFDRVPLELVTIKPTVHVACVEKTEQAIGFLGSLKHGITVGYELIAGLLKEINVVDIVFALGAGSGLWKE